MKHNAIHINGGIIINVDISVKNVIYVKKFVWNPSTRIFENRKYLASIMGDSAIIAMKLQMRMTKQ